MGVESDFGRINCVEEFQFPALYVMATKGAKVGEVLDTTRGEGGWNLRFIRPFNDWEMEEIQ